MVGNGPSKTRTTREGMPDVSRSPFGSRSSQIRSAGTDLQNPARPPAYDRIFRPLSAAGFDAVHNCGHYDRDICCDQEQPEKREHQEDLEWGPGRSRSRSGLTGLTEDGEGHHHDATHHEYQDRNHVNDLQQQSLQGVERDETRLPFDKEDYQRRDPSSDDLQSVGQGGHGAFVLRWWQWFQRAGW